MANALVHQTSPYLLQHAENPVDWYPWGEEALKLAREQNKPILLSIGYSACHWCHVMAHESFEDPQVAAIMNQYFINIKVDREERPDIDQIYQTAHSLMSQRSGGWPLTVFLTPNQEPYYTGTYFPKFARHQLPGFADLMPRVADFYHNKKVELASQNSQVLEALQRTVPLANSAITVSHETLQTGFEQLKQHFDFEHGGFGSAPKFPNPSDIAYLMRAGFMGNPDAQSMALQMLDSMAAGGIYDQIGGGFCRYSVDERWTIPHFEKMLYDNGQLLCLYADGYQISQNPRYKAIIEQTVMWLQREMLSPDGAFYSSLDADSLDVHGHSEEGAFYVWQLDEVEKLLTPEEFKVVSRCFGLDCVANFEGVAWHLFDAAAPKKDEILLFNSAKTKLFQARENRTRPGRDNKILVSWNALVIKGLIKAGRALRTNEYVKIAQNAVDFIYLNMFKNDRLLATAKANDTGTYKVHLNAYLDDYAFLLDALIELMQVEYRVEDMAFAQDLAEALLEEFEDSAHNNSGGFFFTGHHHESLILRTKQAFDNATPSGNGIAAIALQRLGHILGEPRYLQTVERLLQAFDGVMSRNPAACANLMCAFQEYLKPPTMLVLRGDPLELSKWQAAISKIYQPHLMVLNPAMNLNNLPATLSRKVEKNVNAWICSGVECLPVFYKLDEVLKAIA